MKDAWEMENPTGCDCGTIFELNDGCYGDDGCIYCSEECANEYGRSFDE